MLKASRIVVFLCVICSALFAQQANILSFGASANYGPDSINLQTLDPIISVPVRSKGGPVPFFAGYVGAVGCAANLNAPQFWNCGPNEGGTSGGAFSLNVSGLQLTASPASSSLVSSPCTAAGSNSAYLYSKWFIGDSSGNTWHPLPNGSGDFLFSAYCPNSFTVTTLDGSGLTATLASTWNSMTSQMSVTLTIVDKFGNSSTSTGILSGTPPPIISASTSITDPFGNALSFGSSKYVDALNPSGYVLQLTSGGLQYLNATGTTEPITQTLTSKTVKTNFGCSGVTEENQSESLITKLAFPDGTSESFGYEPSTSGNTTGRVNSITLRTGGTVSYTYGTMNCTYYRPLSFTRVGADGTTTFTVSVSGSNGESTTTVLDPGKNKTVYTFTGYPAMGVPASTTNIPILTQVQVYQNTGTVASPVQTLLTTDLICYNGNTTSCASAAVSYPITEKQVTHTINGMSSSSKTVTFIDGGPTGGCAGGTANCYGNVTEVDAYDFGASSPTQKTVYGYGSWTSGNSCSSIGSGIFGKPCYIEVDMGSNVVARSEFQYNSSGAMTKSLRLTGGSNYLTTTYSPNSNGTLASLTPANGGTITYSYSTSTGCPSSGSGLLPTSVTAGGLTNSTSYECNGGTVTGTTDANSNSSTIAFNDSLFRLSSSADPYSFTVTPSYASTSGSSTSSTFNSGNSELISNKVVDTFGRPITAQVGQGPSSSNYDTVSTSYGWFNSSDAAGTNRGVQTSAPCTANSGANCSSFPHTSQADPLGRLLQADTTSFEKVANTYSQNNVLTVLSPAPTGENSKQTESQHDGLGRLTWSCDISSTASGNTACGPNPIAAVNGILTSVSYSSAAGSQTVTTTRGSQSHTATSDALGRITSDFYPETGTITGTSVSRQFTYDATATATCTWTSTPYLGGKLALETDALSNNLCYSYDALGRIVQVNANGTSCRHFYYDNSTGYSGTIPTGPNGNIANNLGRMVEAATDTCAANTLITDEWFSYDKDGRTTDLWESTPHSGGYFHTSVTYWPNGALASLSGIPGFPTITYGIDGEGRASSSVQGSGVNAETLVSSVTYDNVDSPLVITLGTGDSDTYTYDGKENMKTYSYAVGSATNAGTLTWNANNTLGTVAITDGFNSGGTQTCNFGYDDVARLASDNCGMTIGSQSYGYDQYNNLTTTANGLGTSWACTGCYNSSNNQYQTLGTTYDADGHLTYDTFYYYTWNPFGQMATLNTSSSVTCGTSGVCLTYDALGRVAEKSYTNTYFQFVLSPIGRTGLSVSSLSTVTYATIPLPGGSTAISGGSGSTHNYQHLDWQGSARTESSLENSSIFYDRSFVPYGQMYANSGNTTYQEFGGMMQLDLNLENIFDTPNRMFMGAQARFLSPDPARSGWNQYAYSSNPNSFTDPSGLCDDYDVGCQNGELVGTGSAQDYLIGLFGQQPTLLDASGLLGLAVGLFGYNPCPECVTQQGIQPASDLVGGLPMAVGAAGMGALETLVGDGPVVAGMNGGQPLYTLKSIATPNDAVPITMTPEYQAVYGPSRYTIGSLNDLPVFIRREVERVSGDFPEWKTVQGALGECAFACSAFNTYVGGYSAGADALTDSVTVMGTEVRTYQFATWGAGNPLPELYQYGKTIIDEDGVGATTFPTHVILFIPSTNQFVDMTAMQYGFKDSVLVLNPKQ